MNQAAARPIGPRREPVRHVVCRADEIAPGRGQASRDRGPGNPPSSTSMASFRRLATAARMKGQVSAGARFSWGACPVRRAGPLAGSSARASCVRCPWGHGWEFDLKTNGPLLVAIRRAHARVKSYDVAVTGSAELAGGRPLPHRHLRRCRRRATTSFRVSV